MLKEEAENARNEAARAVLAAEAAVRRQETETLRQKNAEQLFQVAEQKLVEAQKEARSVVARMRTSRDRYKRGFVCVFIFAVVIAVSVAYFHRSVLAECGQWFVDRWGNIFSELLSL